MQKLCVALLLLPSLLPAEGHQVVATTYYRTFSGAHPPLKRVKPGDAVITKPSMPRPG